MLARHRVLVARIGQLLVAVFALVTVACQSQTTAHTSSSAVKSSPTPAATASRSSSPVTYSAVPESLTWTGALSGSLITADTQCPTPQRAYLFEATNKLRYVSFELPSVDSTAPYEPGTYSGSQVAFYLYIGDGSASYALYVSTGGSVTIDPNGFAGTLLATLLPEGGSQTSSARVALSGKWRCV